MTFSFYDGVCIFRVVRQINKRGFTSTASKGLHGLTCKLLWTSSNDKHIQKLDTLIAVERSKILRRHGLTWPNTIHSNESNCQAFSNFVDSVCVGKFCILMTSKLLYPCISRTPNFKRFFPWKKCGLYAGKYGIFVKNWHSPDHFCFYSCCMLGTPCMLFKGGAS